MKVISARHSGSIVQEIKWFMHHVPFGRSGFASCLRRGGNASGARNKMVYASCAFRLKWNCLLFEKGGNASGARNKMV